MYYYTGTDKILLLLGAVSVIGLVHAVKVFEVDVW